MEVSKHLVDLITNSLEALAKHVLVMIAEEEGGVALTVTDDGVGAAEGEIERALRGEKAPRGNGLRLLKEQAEQGGYFDYMSSEKGTSVRAVFKRPEMGRVGDALVVFWQEMTAIADITLSVTSKRGVYCFDSRLIGEKYGDPADIRTMVKVREDVNYTLINLFGGNKE